MGMKPRPNDGPKDIAGTVTQAKRTPENGNIPGTVTTSKTVNDSPIPGTVAQKTE